MRLEIKQIAIALLVPALSSVLLGCALEGDDSDDAEGAES